MRSSGRSVAAIVIGSALAGLCSLGLFAAWTQATADIASPDLDEAIRTGPETVPDFSAVPIEQPQAEVAAIRAPGPPAVVEYAQVSAAAVNRLSAPAFRQAETAIREYEPRLQFSSEWPERDRVRSEVSLDLGGRADRRAAGGLNALEGLRGRLKPSREMERHGRWILFASDDNQAVGINLIRSRNGEMRRMSWTADRVSAVGDMQAGVGWRKGAFQASIALVDREISIYGKSRDERFMAFTISIKPRGSVSHRRRDRMQPAAWAPRSNPH
jgi:hypothetical protein